MLKPGAKLGPHEILSLLGAGGSQSRDREGADTRC